MTGREAAKVIREFSEEMYTIKKGDFQRYLRRNSRIVDEMAIRKSVAHELASKCARSEDPIHVIDKYIREIEHSLSLYKRGSSAYSMFLDALTSAIDIYDLIADTSGLLDRYCERRGLL